MWAGFDGTLYTREEFAAHVASKTIGSWVKFIVLHATGEPTLPEWMSYPEPQRLANLQRYYETSLHWNHGPHLFVGPDHICGFSDLAVRGTHCSCWNYCSIGIEQAGNFNPGHDDYNSGDGARVRDNAIFAMAVLHNHLGIKPEPYVYGVSGIHPHSACAKDGHSQCPGAFVDMADVRRRVTAEMARLKGAGTPPSPTPAPSGFSIEPPPRDLERGSKGGDVTVLQAKLGLAQDGYFGQDTERAVRFFQSVHGLKGDGVVGPDTRSALAKFPSNLSNMQQQPHTPTLLP